MVITRLSARIYSFVLGTSLCVAASPAATAQQAPSPYRTDIYVDGAIITGLTGLSVTGLLIGAQKNGLSNEELARLNKNDVPKIDRFAAGNYSEGFQLAGDLLCYPTMLIAPSLLALNPAARGRFGQVAALYLETMMATDATFTMTVGTVSRNRPYLYGPEGGSLRTGRVATNSFFAGHTAHTATATFFTAKVFHDFNPDSPAQPFIWTAAAVLPAVVAYTRIEAGKHFLTDNLVGYAAGATAGILVPQLHKKGNYTGLSVVPMQGLNVNGYSYGGLLLSKRL